MKQESQNAIKEQEKDEKRLGTREALKILGMWGVLG